MRLISKKYMNGTDGSVVTLHDEETDKVYVGWGLHEEMTLEEIYNHNYHVQEYSSMSEYIDSIW